MIGEILNEAKAEGELGQSVSTEMLAQFIFNAWEGTLVRMKTEKNREPLNVFLRILPQITC